MRNNYIVLKFFCQVKSLVIKNLRVIWLIHKTIGIAHAKLNPKLDRPTQLYLIGKNYDSAGGELM